MTTEYRTKLVVVSLLAVGLTCWSGGVVVDAADVATVHGTVTDGSGRGGPLSARIDISGLATPVYTNATTGQYSVDLIRDRAYELTVTATGYRPQRLTVTPAAASVQQDVALLVDAGSCTAPGYARTYAYRETFDASNGGWTGSGTVSWAWGTPTSGPGAAHSGTRVWATNLAGDYGLYEGGDLISPVIDLSQYAGRKPVLMWSQWLQTAGPGHDASIQVSADYGTTWAAVYGPTAGFVDLAWTEKLVVLSEAYAVPGFRLRFRFVATTPGRTYPGWYIDNVGVTVLQVNPTPVYSETFEAGTGGYAGGGTNSSWAWGTPTSGPGNAHAGANAWATNLAGSYNGGEGSAVTSPAIDLSGYAGQWPVVSWWQWLQTGADARGWTTASLEASPDGQAWTTVYGPVYGNVNLAWAQKSLALSPSYASNRLQLRFRLMVGYGGAPGYYVDDVAIHMATMPCEAVGGPVSDPVTNVATVQGTVTDGSGQGWPLYARVDIAGRAMPVFTNPTTGDYTVKLEKGRSYEFTVTAMVAGYRPQRLTVTPAAASVQQDFVLQVDAGSCTAPGYARRYAYRETFEASNGGWTGSGTVSWAWGTPTSGPGAAHSGTRVWATNLAGDYSLYEGGDLISPVIDLSQYAGRKPVLMWSQWLQTAGPGHDASIQVSADYGTTWAAVYGPTAGFVDLAWTEKLVVLSEAYAVPGFRLRFRFFATTPGRTFPGWYLDDVGVTVLQVDPTPVYSETFEAGTGGYAGGGTNSSWAWGTPTSGPGNAHAGANAWATNLAGSYNGGEGSAVTSPAIDLSGYAGQWPVVSWWQWLQTGADARGWTTASLEASPDGQAWTTVYGPVYGNVNLAWAQKSLALSPSYASNRLQLRFRLMVGYGGAPGYYVDDVAIHMATMPCEALTGGLVIGNVTDSASHQGVDGAIVTNTATGDRTTTIVEPLDPANGNGIFVLFSSVTGAVNLTVTEADHKDKTLPVNVPLGGMASLGFTLDPAGPTVYTRYFAEGATSEFFSTVLALLNPGETDTVATLTFARAGDSPVVRSVSVPGRTHVLVDAKTIAGLATAEFSTRIDSDQLLLADRTMFWGPQVYGAHTETAVASPSTIWYLAEGATHSGFNLFYLLQNPNPAEAVVRVRFLLPTGAPLEKTYTLVPNSRTNIWVDYEQFPGLGAALANTDVSAVFEVQNGQPIIVERAMYSDVPNQSYGAGHESAGVTAPAIEWFLAEGATGRFFDLFVLIANPGTADASVVATFLLPDGTTVVKPYTVAANSRFNIWVDYEDARLADTAVSTTIRSTNGVPVIVERAMWWPGPTPVTWYEAHNSAGATTTGTRWALADGLVNPTLNAETYILVANTSDVAADVKVTLLYADGTSVERTYTGLPAHSRFNVPVGYDFQLTGLTHFGAIVESLGPTPAQIVVERAMYWDAAGQRWAAGTNALATKLQ